MLNKNIQEKEKMFEQLNTYSKLKSEITTKFLPFPSILQIFILEKDKLEIFLEKYYYIHIKLKDIYNTLFSFIELPEIIEADIKVNIEPSNGTLGITHFFNIAKYSYMYDFLNSEFQKNINLIDKKNQKVIFNKMQTIPDLLQKIRKTKNFITFADSSLKDSEFKELINQINYQGLFYWDVVENWEVDIEEYNKEFDNSKILKPIYSTEDLKESSLSDMEIKNFIGWEKLIGKRSYLDCNNNLTSLRHLYIENESDSLKIAKNILDKIATFPNIGHKKFGQNIDDIYYMDYGNTSICGKFKNEEYDFTTIFLPETSWLKPNELSIYFIDLPSMYEFGPKEAFDLVKSNFYNIFDFLTKYDYLKIKELENNIERQNIFLSDNLLQNYPILLQNIKTTIQKFKDENIFMLKEVLFFPTFNVDDKSYFKIILTEKQKREIEELIDNKKDINLDSKEFTNKIQNSKITSKEFELSLEHNQPSYFKNSKITYQEFSMYFEQDQPSYFNCKITDKELELYLKKDQPSSFKNLSLQTDSNKEYFTIPTGEDIIESIIGQILSSFSDKEIKKLSEIINQSLFKIPTEAIDEYQNYTTLVYPLILNKEIDIGIFVFVFSYDLINFHFDQDFTTNTITPAFNIVNNFLSQIEKDIYIDLNTKISNLILSSQKTNLLEILNESCELTRSMSIFPSFCFIDKKTYPDIFNKVDLTLANLFIDKQSEYQELMIESIENLKSIGLENILHIGIFNDYEIDNLKAIYLFYFDTNEGEKIENPIIFIIGFKANNIFLYNKIYKNHFINFIKEFIYSFFKKQEVINLKNMEEMMFGMLEHKINNDISVYDFKLNQVMNIVSKSSFIEDYSKIEEKLTFVISRNLEREKTLKAIRPLFLDKQKFAGEKVKVNILDLLKKEIERTKQIKLVIDDIRFDKWGSFQYEIYSDIKEIEMYNETITFIEFIIFETLNNAIKYKDWSDRKDKIDFYIKKTKIKNESYLIISISNRLTDKTLNKFSNPEYITSIFEKGKRLNDFQTTTGSGLGLYIIKNVSEKLFEGKVEPRLENNRLYIDCLFKLNFL